MEVITINNSSKEKLATVYSFLDILNNVQEDKLINQILHEIQLLKNGSYAGYQNKEALKNYALKGSIFSSKETAPCNIENIDAVFKTIKNAVLKCKTVLGDEKLNIFIFPNFDPFVRDKMFGNFGFTPWKNIIHLYMNSFNEEKLAYSIAHEIAHSLSPYPMNENNKIGAILLYEGFAELFREYVMKGDPSPWSIAISKKQANKILNDLNLEEINYPLYNDLFFGSKKYPNWSGYTIGYLLAKRFLSQRKNPNWERLLRKDMNNVKISPKI